jgi:hypothetical protein
VGNFLGVKAICGMALLFVTLNGLAEETELLDPTKPYRFKQAVSSPVEPRQPIVLNYIKKSGDDAVASLNGQSVRVGDRFQGMRVDKITSSGVQLVSSTRSRWVPLLSTPGITKK